MMELPHANIRQKRNEKKSMLISNRFFLYLFDFCGLRSKWIWSWCRVEFGAKLGLCHTRYLRELGMRICLRLHTLYSSVIHVIL